MILAQKKQYAVKQDDDDRKNFDKKWEKLNVKLKQTDGTYREPECNTSDSDNHYLQIPLDNQLSSEISMNCTRRFMTRRNT